MNSTTPLHEITDAARQGLSGSWGKSMGVMLVYMLLMVGVVFIFILGPLLFAAPLIVGLNIYFLATVDRQLNPFELLFEGFGRFGTSWCAQIQVTLIMLAWTVPLVAFCVLLPRYVQLDPEVYPPYADLALKVVPLLIANIFLIWKMLRYSLVLYVVADDETVRAAAAVRRSSELMQGNCLRLIVLWLRFLGWHLLAVLTLGIGLLWLIPYLFASMASFYQDVKDNQ